MVKGILESAICNVHLCKKYNIMAPSIFVDEAHSIDALSHTGKGICVYCVVERADMVIMVYFGCCQQIS